MKKIIELNHTELIGVTGGYCEVDSKAFANKQICPIIKFALNSDNDNELKTAVVLLVITAAVHSLNERFMGIVAWFGHHPKRNANGDLV